VSWQALFCNFLFLSNKNFFLYHVCFGVSKVHKTLKQNLHISCRLVAVFNPQTFARICNMVGKAHMDRGVTNIRRLAEVVAKGQCQILVTTPSEGLTVCKGLSQA
jgi:hypothetical protein